MRYIYLLLFLFATALYAQDDFGPPDEMTGGEAPRSDRMQHPGGPPKDMQNMSPDKMAHMDIERIEKALSLSTTQHDTLLHIFKNYYADLKFYEGKTTPRLLESLLKERDQKACKALDSSTCASYLEIMKPHSRGDRPPPPPPGDSSREQ